jgi:hypothetical protein
VRPIGDPLRVRVDPNSPATYTRASTPRKGKNEAPLAVQVKPKVVDKGKAKVVDTGKPVKVTYPIMTGGVFKIREPKVLTPPSLPISPPVKKGPLVEKPEKPHKAARVLKLLDEEESPEVGGPAKALSEPAHWTHSVVEESVEVVKAPLVKKIRLTKAAGMDVPTAETGP